MSICRRIGEYYSSVGEAATRWRRVYLPAPNFVWRRVVDLLLIFLVYTAGLFMWPRLQEWLGKTPTSFAESSDKYFHLFVLAVLLMVVPALWRTVQNYGRSISVFRRTV